MVNVCNQETTLHHTYNFPLWLLIFLFRSVKNSVNRNAFSLLLYFYFSFLCTILYILKLECL